MRAPLVPIAEKSTTEKVRFAEDAWDSRAAAAELNSAASNPDQQRAERHGVKATFFLVDVTNQHLAEIARLVDGGKLRTNVGTSLTPRGRDEAHFMLERVRPQPKGKIVFAVGAR